MSTKYWGWGSEDDEFSGRLSMHNLKVSILTAYDIPKGKGCRFSLFMYTIWEGVAYLSF